MQIISPRRRETRVEYERVFEWKDQPGAGFSFDSDEHGAVNLDTLSEPALTNFELCVAGELDVVDKGVVRYEHSYVVPAVGRCACGRDVILDGDTRGEGIDCECGRIYNGLGQELAPRSQWEE